MSAQQPVCEIDEVHKDAVEQVRSEMITDHYVGDMADFFKILGDPTRIRIMWALDRRELCVCDLCEILNMTKSAISHQLNSLRKAKLVKYRREGKNVFYSLDDQHVNSIIEIAIDHLSHG